MLWQCDSTIESIIAKRSSDREIVFTNGCFDILHPAHIKLFEFCKDIGRNTLLIIGMNSDASVRRLKGENRPVHSQEYRKFMLSAIRYIDYVTIFDEDTPEDLITHLAPDVLVKGGDYNIDTIVGAKHVQDYGGRVLVFKYIDGYSSTLEIERLKNG